MTLAQAISRRRPCPGLAASVSPGTQIQCYRHLWSIEVWRPAWYTLCFFFLITSSYLLQGDDFPNIKEEIKNPNCSNITYPTDMLQTSTMDPAYSATDDGPGYSPMDPSHASVSGFTCSVFYQLWENVLNVSIHFRITIRANLQWMRPTLVMTRTSWCRFRKIPPCQVAICFIQTIKCLSGTFGFLLSLLISNCNRFN